MANPVAIYSTDPAASSRRGGVNSAQVIQIDPYRSSGRARFTSGGTDYSARVNGQSGSTSRTYEYEAIRRRARAADQFAPNDDYAGTPDDPLYETGRRRAPASMAFAAQQIAQEGLAPGLHFENYRPALAAYAMAAGGNNSAADNGRALEMSV
jgi:hypothetical protein